MIFSLLILACCVSMLTRPKSRAASNPPKSHLHSLSAQAPPVACIRLGGMKKKKSERKGSRSGAGYLLSYLDVRKCNSCIQ
ncbi:hypothetical protein GGI35DRAFT_384394 [Trichoderma velutinum]